jgi:hypothetical protein
MARMRATWIVLLGSTTAWAQPVKLTPKVAAPCGPDYLERHATSVSDLDGNGTLDRVGITREATAIVVRLYELPSLVEKASWKLTPANGYLEVATPRRRDSKRGDLWITVGVPAANNGWDETLYHLEGGKLAPISTKHRNLSIRVDVDGDRREDPIGTAGTKPQALLANGTWLTLPSSEVEGAPIANQQQEATDLDGNGTRDLVVQHLDKLSVVEVPAMREVWSVKGKPFDAHVVRWGAELVVVASVDEKLRVYSGKGALITQPSSAASYSLAQTAIGSQLVVTGHPWHFYDRANPTKSTGTVDALAARIDDAVAPFGPFKLAATDVAGLVAVTHTPGKPLVLSLVDPATRALRRVVWTAPSATSRVSDDTHTTLVDLDRDGVLEILVEDVTRTVMHHGASWNTYQMRLVSGATAKVLWQEPGQRSDRWTHDGGKRGKMRQTQVDGTHVRAFDLGDGTMPLRVRSARDEYYILAASSKLKAVPACLE